MKTKRKSWKRHLQGYFDWTTYLVCAGLFAVGVWLSTTRPTIPFSFTGTSTLLNCELAPVPTMSEGQLIEYPHFHVPADALMATGAALRLDDEEETASARDSIPQSAQATAVIKFRSRYTVRLYMHKGYELTIMPGDAVAVASSKQWSSLGIPDKYTIGFRFHYPSGAPSWQVVGTDKVDFTLNTLGFDKDQNLEKPTGKRLRISGASHYFQGVPIALGCCSAEWPPLMGEHVTLGPNGQTADFESMLMVKVHPDNGTELVDGAPLMCASATLEDSVGEFALSASNQLLRSPTPLRIRGYVRVREISDGEQTKQTVAGDTTSVTINGNELVPTRLEAMGAFWAGLLSTTVAALLVALIATKGRVMQHWLSKR